MALRNRPKSGWASNSSGRAVPTIRSGTASAWSARCSRNASIAVIGPVQVLEDQHGGVLLGDVLRNRRHAVKSSSRSAVEVASIPSSGNRRWRNQGRSAPSGSTVSSLALSGVGRVGLQDPGVGLQDLPERPERDALPVGQAPTLAPGDELGLGVDVGGELGHDAGLAEPGFPHDGDELRRRGRHRLVEDALQQREIDLATDERGVVGAGEIGAEASQRGSWRGRAGPVRTCP